MNTERERNSNRARRLRLILAIGIGVAMMAARRTNGSEYGCRRGFYPRDGASTAFLGTGTSTFGGQSFPALFLTPDPMRRMYLLSDTSAQTYVFDQDITNTTQRFGAGVNIPCGVYATQGDAFCVDGCDESSDNRSQSADFVSLCGVPLGQDVRFACRGRGCPTCTLLAPPECFVRNAERLNYVPEATIEEPQPLKSAQLPWDLHHDAPPQDFAMGMDAAGTEQWPNPIRSIRSHDTGACRINIPWASLATLVNNAFLPLFLEQLRQSSAMEQIFNARVEGSAGPQLRGNSTTSFDEVFLRNEVYAYVQVGIPWSVERHMSGVAFTRFSVAATTNAAGFARVSVPYITSWSDHLPTTDWEVGEALAKVIPGASVFPKAFSEVLRDAMLVPAYSSGGVVATCTNVSNHSEGSVPGQAGVTECGEWFAEFDTPPPGMQSHFAGPERGCYPRSAFQSIWNSALPANAVGICATRLQAQNVNLLPEALQIVIVNQGLQDPTPDAMARLVAWLPGAVNVLLESTGISFHCNPTVPPATARLHLIDSRSVNLTAGTTNTCGLPMTPSCGNL